MQSELVNLDLSVPVQFCLDYEWYGLAVLTVLSLILTSSGGENNGVQSYQKIFCLDKEYFDKWGPDKSGFIVFIL